MRKRLAIDSKLKLLLGETFTVYFQPPNNLEMNIPACVYTFDGVINRSADNVKFAQFEKYTIKLIVQSCDDPVVETFLKEPSMSYVTMYPTSANQYNFLFRTSI